MSEEVTINWWGNNFSGTGAEVLDESILNQAMPALERMIHRDKNHPCVIIWSMANESRRRHTCRFRRLNDLARSVARSSLETGSRLPTVLVSGPFKKFMAADVLLGSRADPVTTSLTIVNPRKSPSSDLRADRNKDNPE